MFAKFFLIAAALFTFITILRSRRNFDDAKLPVSMALLGLLTILSFFVMTGLAYVSAGPLSALVGVAGLGVSYFVFTRSLSALNGRKLKIAFDPLLPDEIINNGIYSRIRHPMYTAYIVFWISYAIGSSDWRSAILAAILVCIYTFLAFSEERRMLASPNRETYKTLMSRTGMFWPKPQ